MCNRVNLYPKFSKTSVNQSIYDWIFTALVQRKRNFWNTANYKIISATLFFSAKQCAMQFIYMCRDILNRRRKLSYLKLISLKPVSIYDC